MLVELVELDSAQAYDVAYNGRWIKRKGRPVRRWWRAGASLDPSRFRDGDYVVRVAYSNDGRQVIERRLAVRQGGVWYESQVRF
jgi:hypothetical protein